MKIVHLIDIPWWSGLSFYAYECVLAHRASGHEVIAAVEDNSLFQEKVRLSGIETVTLAGRKFWQSPINLYRIAEIVARHKPDCIVAHTGSTHWIAVVCGLAGGIPVIRTRCRSSATASTFHGSWIYRQTRCTVSASRGLNREILDRLPHSMKRRAVTLYPPLEMPENSAPSENSPRISRRIGVLARLDPVKGLENFLSAAKTVQQEVPDAEFAIAGAEENLKWSDLSALAADLGLKNVVYHGFIRPAQVPEFVQNCGIGVISSVRSEEISRALLEWFSAGRPVVASAVGCIPEILENGTGGFTVNPADSIQMARKLVDLLKNPELALHMGQFNKRLVQERFSRAKFQSGWDNILESL